jgi:hypothetical protein
MRDLARWVSAREAGRSIEKPPDLSTDLFDVQRAFIEDPARRKAALCGRRAGKTFGMARYLAQKALARPGAMCLYIALTRLHAKRLIWDEVKRLSASHGLGARANESELELTFPNGGKVFLAGADKEDEIEKFRGLAFDLVVLDEAASFGGFFKRLVEEVLEPGLEDYAGTLCMVGSPGMACAGYFHDATNGLASGWSVHRWTVRDNPRFPRWTGQDNWRELAEQWIAGYLAERKWDENHPTFQREMLGKWVKDSAGLVYHYDPVRNDYQELPAGHDWRTVMGVDFGFDDAFALVVIAFCSDLPDVFQVDEFDQVGFIPSQWAEMINQYRAKHKPVKIMADTGALGKAIALELQTRHGIPLTPAQKTDKLAAIELLNADLERGLYHAKRGSHLASQMSTLPWSEDRKKEDERFGNDLCDANLYAYREAWHWTYRKPQERIKPGSKEYWEAEERAMEEEAEDEVESQESFW